MTSQPLSAPPVPQRLTIQQLVQQAFENQILTPPLKHQIQNLMGRSQYANGDHEALRLLQLALQQGYVLALEPDSGFGFA